MSDMDLAFSRALLREGHNAVKLHFPEVNLRKAAWVYHFMHDHWEFHGPDGFYWHGRAGDAYEARYKGWMAWLKSKGVMEDAA